MTATMPRDTIRRVTVMQGETRVSDDPAVVLTTILGSCISACFFDPVARVGGLNHFLLAEPGHAGTDTASMQRYGVYAMEVLINAMLSLGANRASLRARIYGGASMHDGFHDIGTANAAFARRFLKDERIVLVGEDVGGRDAKRVEFRPTLGLARCRTVAERPVIERRPAVVAPPAPTGDVEFF